MKALIKKIISQVKTIDNLTKNYHVSLLASAIVFHLLLVAMPLLTLFRNLTADLAISFPIFEQLAFLTTDIPSANLWSSLFLIGEVLWVSSQFVNILNHTSDVVYDTGKRHYLKTRILSLLMTLTIVIVIMVFFIFLAFYSYWQTTIINYLHLENVTILSLGLDILRYLIIWSFLFLIISLLYKMIIPVKIALRKTMLIALLVVVIWTVVSFAYRFVIWQFEKSSLTFLYGSFAGWFLILSWAYTLTYIFVYGLIFNYYRFQKSNLLPT